jgi:hypothetical protein
MTGSASQAAVFRGQDLLLEMLDADAVHLVRLFRHVGGDWQAPDLQYRNLRADPPAGRKAAFATLYTANSLCAAAVECGVLRADHLDRYVWDEDLAKQYRVVRYTHREAAVFIPLDGRNRDLIGLAGGLRRFAGYEPFQEVALQLFMRFGRTCHGLCWESFHRNQPGRVYAVWHHRKESMGLRIESSTPYVTLADDAEWRGFLAACPDVKGISAAPSRH